MISGVLQKWAILIYVMLAMGSPQYPYQMSYPMFTYQQMFPMMQQQYPLMIPMVPESPMQVPIPIPVPVPYGIAIVPNEAATQTPPTTPKKEGIITTTSTKCPFHINQNNTSSTPRPADKNNKSNNSPGENGIALAVPMPIPIQVPFPMPMPMPAPIPESQPQPMPIPLPQPVPQPMPQQIPAPMPIPQPVQFAIPAVIPSFCQKNNGHPSCPPCPPCTCVPCTPAFFSYCSQCHLICRCRNGQSVPIPKPPIPPLPLPGSALPMPLPLPYPGHIPIFESPNVYLIPFPPQMANPQDFEKKTERKPCNPKHLESSSDDDSFDIDSVEKHKKTYDIYRRSHNPFDNHNDNKLVKPVLNYIADDGEVKIRKTLSKNEANMLTENESSPERVNLLISDDKSDGHQAVRLGSPGINGIQIFPNNKNIFFNQGTRKQSKKKDTKKLMYIPSKYKTISNVSLMFNVEE